MAEPDNDPIRRWKFVMHLEEGVDQNLSVNVFGRKADTEEMSAFIKQNYEAFSRNISKQARKATVEAIPFEQVSEETKAVYDAMANEMCVLKLALGFAGIVISDESIPKEKKVLAFNLCKSKAEELMDDKVRLYTLFRFAIQPDVEASSLHGLITALTGIGGADVKVHVIRTRTSEGTSTEDPEPSPEDKKTWN